MKISKRTLVITSLVTLIPVLVGICLWDQLPDVMATHFGMSNEPNGWTSKGFTVFGIPSVLVLLQLVAIYTTSKDPRKVFHNNTLMNIVVWIIPVIAVVVLGITYMYNMEVPVDVGMVCLSVLGVLFMILGNYLPNCRRNYFVGIRLPWTLRDDANWNYTHRIGGFVFVIMGLIFVVNAFILPKTISFVAMIVGVLVPTVASFMYFVKHGVESEEE